MKNCVWEYLFPFYKKGNTHLCLCPNSNDVRKDFKAFYEMFNKKNGFSPTAELRKFCTKVTQEGIEDPDNVVIWPASASQQAFNEVTIGRVVTTLSNVFPNILPVKYNPLCLNEIISTSKDSILDAFENLELLYPNAFPQEIVKERLIPCTYII